MLFVHLSNFLCSGLHGVDVMLFSLHVPKVSLTKSFCVKLARYALLNKAELVDFHSYVNYWAMASLFWAFSGIFHFQMLAGMLVYLIQSLQQFTKAKTALILDNGLKYISCY